MKTPIHLFLLPLFFLIPVVTFSQDFLSVRLSQSDRKQGILSKYQRSAMESSFELILYKNGTFAYHSFENIVGEKISEGQWQKLSNLLVLNSTVGEKTLPLKIDYSNDSINIPKNKVHPAIYNAKGEPVEDALVAINNDSCLCTPLMDLCFYPFDKIDSIRLIIGNTRCSSAWVNIMGKNYKQLKITVLSDINFSRYVGFTDSKFEINKTGLNKLEEN
jgi:hypothetical protein